MVFGVADLAGKADYTVVDTDYNTYAVVFECQKLAGFLHRKSTAILSRSPSLLRDIITKVRSLFVDLIRGKR